MGMFDHKELPPRPVTPPVEDTPGAPGSALLVNSPGVDPFARVFDGSVALERIRGYARWRGLGPMGFLAGVLAHVAASLPPTVTLDIGKGPGTLNVFFALGGKSGSGKSEVIKLSREAVVVAGGCSYAVKTPGSGEGIVSTYAPPKPIVPTGGDKKPQPVPVRREESVLWAESEVTSLAAMTGRQGASLAGFMLKMWSAEMLNITTKTAQLETVAAGSYRAALVLGVQPDKAHVLLSESGNGTLQRYVWVPMNDPGRIPQTEYPQVPPLHVNVGRYAGRSIMGCESARQASMLQTDRMLITGDPGGVDSHAIFLRAKIATLIAVIREHKAMTEDDWERAGAVMDISALVRSEAEEHLRQREVDERAAMLDRDEQARVRHNLQRESQRREIAADIAQYVEDNAGTPGGANLSKFKQGQNSRKRPLVESIVTRLDKANVIRVETLPTGAKQLVRGEFFTLSPNPDSLGD